MKRRSACTLAATLIAAACSSGTDDRAPGVGYAGESSANGGVAGLSHGGFAGRSQEAAAGSAADAGASGQATRADDGGASGEGGLGGDGGDAGLAQGMVVPIAKSACSEAAMWGDGKAVPQVSSAANETLLSLSADELDLLFMRGQDVLLAHRARARDPFAEPTLVTIPAGYDASVGATLSSDGKSLILVASDGKTFASLSRATRTAAFDGPADTTAFSVLNQLTTQILEDYAAPVLAPNGKTLLFTAFTPKPAQGFPQGYAGTAAVYESPWSGERWERPQNVSEGLFDGTTLARPLPTGLSADSRTLFYFDEASAKEFARFRDRPDAPLTTILDLGEHAGAIPNGACDTLYYFSNGDVLSVSE